MKITKMFQANLKTYGFIAMALLVGIALGYIAAKNSAYNLGLAEGKREIEEKYRQKMEEIFPSAPEPEEIFSVSGMIVDIKDKELILEETVYPSNPLEETSTRRWQVRIADSAKIMERVEKTMEELEQEPGSVEGPGLPFKEVETEFSKLTIGQEIIAEAGENVKGKTAFEAIKIILINNANPF